MRGLVPAIFASLLAATALHAQTAALRLRVIDAKTRGGIAGAEVIVDGHSAAARTDADGTYRIDGLSQGMHTVRVRRLGYATYADSVALPRELLTIMLFAASRELDAVVVTAARREQRLKDVVPATELVNRSEIESTGADNIAAVLSGQTGVQFTGGHPSGASVSLEGLSDQRVLVLVDGMPLYGAITGGLDLTRIPAAMVDRVEVVKGPQSTLYGSEAMGGVINVITRHDAGATDLVQTAGTGRRSDSDLFTDLSRGRYSLTTSVGHQYAEYTPGISATTGALTDRLSGMLGVSWNATEKLAATANALVLNDRQRWPNGSLYQFADNTQLNGRVGVRYGTAGSILSATVYLSQLEHLSRSSQYEEPIRGTGDSQRQRLEQADVAMSRPVGSAVLDAGATARHEFIYTSDNRVAGGSRTLNSTEPFAQLEIGKGRVTIVPGARLTWSEAWGTFVSPKVAARIRVDSSLTLRAALGKGFRAPDFKELYLDFTNTAAFYAVHGNAQLRPESSMNASASAEWDGSHAYARASVFANQLHDFIETVPLASVGSFAQYTYQNVARGSTRGVETTVGLTRGLARVDVGYAHLTGTDESSGAPLLGQPRHSGRALVALPLPGVAQLTATEIVTGRTPMASTTSGIVTDYRDAFARTDLRVARSLTVRADLSVGIDNLFDAEPARWADATGRQVYVTLKWHFR